MCLYQTGSSSHSAPFNPNCWFQFDQCSSQPNTTFYRSVFHENLIKTSNIVTIAIAFDDVIYYFHAITDNKNT